VCRRVGGTKGARGKQETIIFLWKRKNYQLGIGFFVHHRSVSTVKVVEFVSDRMSYIALRGRWCNIIDPNVHAPSEMKRSDSVDSFMRN
jgi:hypothetical protein